MSLGLQFRCAGSFEDDLGLAAVAVDAAAAIDVHGDCVRVWEISGMSVLVCLHPLLAEALASGTSRGSAVVEAQWRVLEFLFFQGNSCM